MNIWQGRLDASQCRVLAKEYRDLAQETGSSKESAFIMSNIARSLMGLATQLDLLASKIREEGRRSEK